MSRTTATVRVRLVVDVTTASAWGPDCTIQQVREQGASQAENILRNALKEEKRARVANVESLHITIDEGGMP